MTELSKKSTVYFEPDIHYALRIKAATTHQSVSEIVNEAELAIGSKTIDEIKPYGSVRVKLLARNKK